jgi:phage tail sheath protein FI
MAIIDVPRNLVLKTNQKFIRKTKPENTFTNTIGPKLKYITGLNSSYLAVYSNWTRVFDGWSGNNVWMPPSIKATGIYIRTDITANIWDAPAGLNRGTITETNDLSFNPRPKEADLLYTKSFNYARLYPLEGAILEGQKTSQVKPSAFDRVNVRRLFLRLERFVYQVSRYYVMEPNNEFTRRSLVAAIEPQFASVKAAGGLYDYRIVCDETNNTAQVIDNNELKVAILLKPVRTAEFILVDFIATRTDANFDEFL